MGASVDLVLLYSTTTYGEYYECVIVCACIYVCVRVYVCVRACVRLVLRAVPRIYPSPLL